MSSHHNKPAHEPKVAVSSEIAPKPSASGVKPSATGGTPLVTTETGPSGDSAGGDSRFSPLFTLALVVIATLPIGLGLGVAFRPKPVALAPAEEIDHHKSSSEPLAEEVMKSVLANRQKAEELFRSGEFELALRMYQSKEKSASLRPNDRIVLQMATCHEALGEWDEALEAYRALASRARGAMKPVALVSQGRVWISLRDLSKAAPVLNAAVRLAEQDASIPEPVTQEARFLSGIVSVLNRTAPESSGHGRQPIPPLRDVEWPLQKLAEQLGDPKSEGDSHASSSDPVVTTDSETVSAIAASEITDDQLRELIEKHPKHWLAGHAKLALAHAAYHRGDWAQAVAIYDELIKPSATGLSVTAAFNRGLVQYYQGEYGSAATALGRMVDGAPGHEFVIPALIMRGRALMEIGDFETGAFDFKRAATLRGPEEDRAWATAFMGMAFLQMHRNQQAAQTMFALRDRIDSGPPRAAAGFLVSLARMEALADEESRQREAVFLFRALSSIDPEAEWLGSTGTVLLGRAYRSLNLPEKMIEIYSKALENKAREPFASEMKLALAEQALASGDLEVGRAMLQELQQDRKSRWYQPAALRLARQEFDEGRLDECIALCHTLAETEMNRPTVLKLLGTAYEQAGQFDQAAICYAGQLPKRLGQTR